MNMRTICVGVLIALSALRAAAEPLRVGRYTQVTGSDPADMDPLAVTAQVHFPREVVSTVGDALTYLLQRTGYSLLTADADAEHLLALPLPESQRIVGPRKVEYLVRTLVGDAFGLCINARAREVSVAAIGGGAACLSKQLRGE
ncbi:hypothetical protein [Uliginosibacterium gangwonense]|uniref:PFGI-1 class ICE element type IV pilus protein PilL2 n=1 Tax=Uliginosibacterium gangwonense TaxID=392736 RepID=UPI00036D3CCB|nr:hypothetical protein [Uliginosibacterium gangwonense]